MTKAGRLVASLMMLLAIPSATAMAADAAGLVQGVVVDGARDPIAGMAVRVTDVVDPSRTYSATSDDAGRFAVKTLPSGSYLVSADTVNTTWIQKDDSPVVDVTDLKHPDVTLVLVRTSDLAPDNDDDDDGLLTAALVVSGVAAAASIASLVELDSQEEDIDTLNQKLDALQSQNQRLQETIEELQRELNRLREHIDELNREELARIQELEDLIRGLYREIDQLQRQIDDLEDLIDRRHPASPSR